MKKWLMLAACVMLCTSCAALPGEERAFAVALGVDHDGSIWTVGARIPVYASGGGYATLSARGDTLGGALAQLNAAAPMELHYGQTRLIVLTERLACGGQLPGVMALLARQGEVRPQAALCVTQDPLQDVMDALKPQSGSRLSKALETTLTARRQLGVTPVSTLADDVRMGERQQPILAALTLRDGQTELSGGGLMGMVGCVRRRLDPAQMQLVSLMAGTLRQGTVAIPGCTFTMTDASSRISLEGNTVLCRVKLTCISATVTQDALADELRAELEDVVSCMAQAGCDALGIARQAVRGSADLAAWHAYDWPERYPQLTWRIEVAIDGEI